MLIDSFQSFRTWFWNPDWWLPLNFSWADIRPNDKIQYAKYEDIILFPIPAALFLIIFRIILERNVFKPLGRKLGIKDYRRRNLVILNEEEALEKAYKCNAKFSAKDIEGLAKSLDLEIRQVERWLRRRLVRDKPTKLIKFSESCWRFTFYTSSLFYGTFILWDKPWFWDISHCWTNYPHHSVPNEVWWYYMLGSSFYWSLTFSQFFDVKRNDFFQMFCHHVITIILLAFSWTCNLSRIGSLVLVLHDIADVFMEFAKLSKYAEYHRLCNFLFAIFSFLWIFTRVGVFPLYILRSTLTDGIRVVPQLPGYGLNFMLVGLLCLHVFWTCLLIQAINKVMWVGGIDKDSRSSTESESGDDSETNSNSNKKKN